MLSWEEFEKVEMHVGTVVRVEEFPEARKPAFKLWIDFGQLGIKKTSAQITQRYTCESLLGKQVVAVTNFPPKQVGPFMSECLVLGVVGESGDIVLLGPDTEMDDGLRIA